MGGRWLVRRLAESARCHSAGLRSEVTPPGLTSSSARQPTRGGSGATVCTRIGAVTTGRSTVWYDCNGWGAGLLGRTQPTLLAVRLAQS